MSSSQEEQSSSPDEEPREPPEGHSSASAAEGDGAPRAAGGPGHEVPTARRAQEWLSVMSELTLRLNQGKPPSAAAGGGVDGAARGRRPPEGAETSSEGPTERGDSPTHHSRGGPGVFYDDVPDSAGVDHIYEEIEGPGQRRFSCWSSGEFESYDEPPETPAGQVQRLVRAASRGTRSGWNRTRSALRGRLSFLQKKPCTEEGGDGAGDVAGWELEPPPARLCPPPEGLSRLQVVRRLILNSIVQSEQNYLDSLQRTLQEYRKPLLEPPRSILNPKKVCQIFYRLQEIHQCHCMFQMALGSRVAEWDHNEQIGDLLVASFSKSMVLSVYSDYMNNFSNAIALIKKACLSKPAFLDFLKKQQARSPDRITLYGLMVKPIQRFPHLILLLQDMLKSTPSWHSDRLPLQLALSELETLAARLREQKHLADQEAELQQLALSGGGAACNKLLSSQHQRVIHCELLTEIVYGEGGRVLKSRERKVFLLQDKLICVNVNSRYTVKWCAPLLQTQLLEVGPDRAVPGRRHSSSSTGVLGPPTLHEELEELQHDLAVVEEVCSLVGTLSGLYQNLNSTVSQDWRRALQRLIRLKEEEIQKANKCRLSLSVPRKPDRSGHPASVTVVFNTPSPLSKIHWLSRLHLAKMAQRKENQLGWERAEEEKKTRALSSPVLVCRLPVFSSTTHGMKAAVHSPSRSGLLGLCTTPTCLPQGCLWVAGGGQVEVFSLTRSSPRSVKTVPLQAAALSLNRVPFPEGRAAEEVQGGDVICVGLQDGSIKVYSSIHTAGRCLRTLVTPHGSPVLCLQHFLSFLLAGLASGHVAAYQTGCGETLWDVEPCRVLPLGSEAVGHLLPVDDSVWASCGNRVTVVRGAGLLTQSFEAHPDGACSVRLMVCWGRGVWMAFTLTSSIQLFHTETLGALQEVDLSARTPHLPPGRVCVSSLLICQGSLWVGTSRGVILTLPVEEGVPSVTGKGLTSLNGHCGPVDFLVSASSSVDPGLLVSASSSVDPGLLVSASSSVDPGLLVSASSSVDPGLLVSASSSVDPGLLVSASSSVDPGLLVSASSSVDPGLEEGGAGERVGASTCPPSHTLLQYRLRSTGHLPGKVLTAQPEQDPPRPAPPSPETSPEDGSIYEVREDVWVRGRPVDRGRGGESRRTRLTSTAVFSGGRGYRRVGQEVTAESCSDRLNTLLVWQLPLTVTQQQGPDPRPVTQDQARDQTSDPGPGPRSDQ